MNRLALLYNPRWSPICAIVLANIIVYTRVHRVPAPAGPTLLAGVHARKCPPKKPALPLRIAAVGGQKIWRMAVTQAVEPAYRPLWPCKRMYIGPQGQLGFALPGGVHASKCPQKNPLYRSQLPP
jgi:hypothetical protein